MPTWVRLGLLCTLWSGCMVTKMSLCALCAVSHLCYLCGWLTASSTRIYLRTFGSRIWLSSTRRSGTRMHRKAFVRMSADLLNFRCEKQFLLIVDSVPWSCELGAVFPERAQASRRTSALKMVPGKGLEPPWPDGRRILSYSLKL